MSLVVVLLTRCAPLLDNRKLNVMGLDRDYQAMPDGCTLLERARHEPASGGYLESFYSWNYDSEPPPVRNDDDKAFVEFLAAAKEVVEHHPGIKSRYLYLGRRWDMLHYLLSENRRKGDNKEWSHWVDKAIFGGQILNEETITTIGSPIRYLPPSEVLYVAENLGEISSESLRHHWNPQAMCDAKVYKSRGADNESFGWVKEDFEKLKCFYALVAAHSEGVLSFMG
jgi:hypothetical protein